MSSGRRFLDLDEDSLKCDLFSATILESPVNVNSQRLDLVQGLSDNIYDLTYSTSQNPWPSDKTSRNSQLKESNCNVRVNEHINTNEASANSSSQVNATETRGIRAECPDYWNECIDVTFEQMQGSKIIVGRQMEDCFQTRSIINVKAGDAPTVNDSCREGKAELIEFQLTNNMIPTTQNSTDVSESPTAHNLDYNITSSSQEGEVFNKQNSHDHYGNYPPSCLQDESNLSGGGNETHFKEMCMEGECHYVDELNSTVISDTTTRGEDSQECFVDYFSAEDRSATSKHTVKPGKGFSGEGGRDGSTCWHSHPSGRYSCHDNLYPCSIKDSPQKPHNYKELLSRQVPPDNDTSEAGGESSERNTAGNEGFKFMNQIASTCSTHSIDNNDGQLLELSSEYTDNNINSDDFVTSTTLDNLSNPCVLNDKETSSKFNTSKLSSLTGHSYNNRQFETLELDPYAPAPTPESDLFGDLPFGHGDPFAVQSPDPFDDDPFQVLVENRPTLGFSTQDTGFRSPLRFTGSSSLYKITEEAEDTYIMDQFDAENKGNSEVEDSIVNNSHCWDNEPMLIDFHTPDVQDRSLDMTANISGIDCDGSRWGYDTQNGDNVTVRADSMNQCDKALKSEIYSSSEHSCDRDMDECDIHEKAKTYNKAKKLVDSVLSKAVDEISEKSPSIKNVQFSVSNISDHCSNSTCSMENTGEVFTSGEQGPDLSASSFCKPVRSCSPCDFTLDLSGNSIKNTASHHAVERGSQSSCHIETSCVLPAEEDPTSSNMKQSSRHGNNLPQTSIPWDTLTKNIGKQGNFSVSDFAKQIVCRVLIASMTEVESFYNLKNVNSQNQTVYGANNDNIQASNDVLDTDSYEPDHSVGSLFHRGNFSVSIEVEECSSPEGSCGCIPPPQIRIDECATPMGSECGDFYSMFNGVENTENPLDEYDASEMDSGGNHVNTVDLEMDHGNYSNSVDIDYASISHMDNDQVSSLDGDNEYSDNQESLSGEESEERYSPRMKKYFDNVCSDINRADDEVHFHESLVDYTVPPCVQIDECSSQGSSPDEWHEVYAKSQACSVPVINIQGCSSREPSSDEEDRDNERNCVNKKREKRTFEQVTRTCDPTEMAAVTEFIDQVIMTAIEIVQKSSMVTEQESVERVDGPMKQGYEQTTQEEEENYSEEIKHLHDQIPEELSVPISSLQSRGVNQTSQKPTKFHHQDVSSVNPVGISYDSSSHRGNISQTIVDFNEADDYEEDFIADSDNACDMSNVNVVIQRELSLAEELSQSMHEEQQNTDLDLTAVGQSLDNSDKWTDDGAVTSFPPHEAQVETGSREGTSDSVYDNLIDRVLMGCGKKQQEKKPDVTNYPSHDSGHSKRKILPTLELLSPEDELEPRSDSRMSSSTDTDYSMGSRTPDDTRGEVHRLPSCGSDHVGPSKYIPEYSAREEFENNRNWRSVEIGGKIHKIDMRVIEPYKKVLSHGGYYGDGFNAIIVFAGCHLPDKRRRDYDYVMDNLFLYVVSTLELLVVEDYMIVYFHGATPNKKMPGLRWLKQCYEMIDRKLKKNLKQLLIVHPTLWLKTVVVMTKPFVSSKFYHKIKYVKSLFHLTQLVPTEYIFVPDEIQQYDASKNKSDYRESYTES